MDYDCDGVELKNTQRSNRHYSLLISVFALNIILPNLVLSYGAILAAAVEDHDVRAWKAFATPVIFVGSFSMAQCWCREAADSFGGRFGYRLISALGISLVFIGVCVCAFLSPIFQALAYGLFGGFGVCLISAQVDALVFDTFDTKLGLVRSLCISGQAIGQLLLPHFITFLIDTYGYYMHFMLLSSVVLQMLPFTFYLKSDQSIKRYSLNRYSQYLRQFSSTSDMDSNNLINDIQLHDLGRKSWKSPADDTLSKSVNTEVAIHKVGNRYTPELPPVVAEERKQNLFGVEILPDIPEESEDEGSRRNTINDAIKRLSIMSDRFQDSINRNSIELGERTGDVNEYGRTDTIITNDFVELRKVVKRENSVRNSFHAAKRNFRIPSYKMYKLRKRIRYCCRSFFDIFVEPLMNSLSCPRFYPALILNVSRLCLIIQMPTLMQLYTYRSDFHLSISQGNMLISLHAMSWLSFIICSPWISNLPKGNYKYLTFFGTFTSALGVVLTAFAPSVYSLRIGCIVSGLGFGGVVSTWENTTKEFLGIRNWTQVQSTLETFSGVSVLIIFTCLLKYTSFDGQLHFQMQLLAGIQLLSAAIWLVISIISIIYSVKVTILRQTNNIFD